MVMRKTSDIALILIPEKALELCLDAIREVKSAKWSCAYSKRRGILLIRRRATGKWNEKMAADIESSLAKVVPDLLEKLV